MVKNTPLFLLYGLLILFAQDLNDPAVAWPLGEEDAAQDKGVEVVVSMSKVAFRGLPCVAEVMVINHTQKPPDLPLIKDQLALSAADRKKLVEQHLAFYLRLPSFGLMSKQPPPFSIQVTDSKGVRRVDPEEPGVLAFYYVDWRALETAHGPDPTAFRRPTVPVPGGTSANFLLDLMPWVDKLPVGTYELVISAFSDWKDKRFESQKVSFEVRAVDKSIGKMIQAAVPAIKDDELNRPSGFDWFNTNADCAMLRNLLPPDVYQHLAMVCLLKAAREFDGKGDVPEELVSSLPLFLKDKADALFYEMVSTRGDEAVSHALWKQILEKRPDLERLLDRVKRGVGLLLTDPSPDNASAPMAPESKEDKK